MCILRSAVVCLPLSLSLAFHGDRPDSPAPSPPTAAEVADALKQAKGEHAERLMQVANQLRERNGPHVEAVGQSDISEHPLFSFAAVLKNCPAARDRFADNSLDLLERFSLGTVQPTIWHGERTKDYPECVAVGLAENDQPQSPVKWFCSGVLVSPSAVLTASHCDCAEEDAPATRWRVKRGASIDDGAEPILVKCVRDYWRDNPGISRPKCPDGKNKCDLRMLVLARKQMDVVPAALAATATIDKLKNVTIVGFGRSQTENFGKKRCAVVPMASPACTEDGAEDLNCYASEEFVASDPDTQKDSCSGDSGGPAFVNPMAAELPHSVAGIVVRRVKKPGGPCGPGGVYLRVDGERAVWILDRIKQYE